MASIKISGDTSGVITVSAPAASGTNTITMPAATGTMALTSDIVGSSNASDLTSGTLPPARIGNSSIVQGKTNFVSTSGEPGLKILGDGSSQDGYIQLNCSQNTHGVKIKAPPHSASASYTLTLPNNDGDANQFLQTNGSGVTTWAAASGGGGGSGGKILQVKQGVLTTSFSTTSNSYVDLVTIAITPAATSSKILVSFTTNGGTGGDINHGYLVLHRNTTEIGSATYVSSSTGAMAVANTSAGQQLNYTGSLLDSPNTTSAITYKLKVKSSNSNAVFINRSGRDADNTAYDGRTVSQITVMEVGA